MTSYSPVRYLHLIKHRPRFLLLSVGISTAIAAVIGLVSPYLYSSTALVQYQPKVNLQLPMADNNVVFHKVTLLVTSTKVLNEVAKTLATQPLDPYYYFPKTIPVTDIRTRGKLLLRHLGLQKPVENWNPLTRLPLNFITAQLGRHLKVGSDTGNMTISITYEAGDPEIAQRITNLVADTFTALNLEQEKDELKRQEKYIEDAIARQMDLIHSAESGLRSIVEDHPSMAVNGDGEKAAGVSPAAQRYVKKQERLEKIDEELISNQKMLASIQQELGGSSSQQAEISGNIASKVTEELSELEFRRLNSVKFGGYTEDHPSIYKLDKRIGELKEVLANLGVSRGTASGKNSVPGGDVRGLFAQATSLREKNRALRAEKEVLFKSLEEEDSKFRQAVKVNFEYDSIGRNLSTSQTILNELYRDLQKTRLSLSGMSASATVLANASYSPHSTNLSIQRRIFFAAFTNLALIFSLLILYEIFRPSLLVSDDLRSLKLSHLGLFKPDAKGFAELASCLWSLGETKNSTLSDRPKKRLVSLINFAPTVPYDTYANDLAQAAAKDGQKVALVFLDDTDSQPTASSSSVVTVRRVKKEDALVTLRGVVNELRTEHDMVMVAETGKLSEPVETLLAQLTEHFVYLAEFGRTFLAPISNVRYLPELPRNVRHFSAVVDTPPIDLPQFPLFKGPMGPKLKSLFRRKAA